MSLRPRRIPLGTPLGALALAFALAGCAGGAPADDGIAHAGGAAASAAPSGTASAPVDRHEAQLKFAQCMREHGVDMPDPGPDGNVRIMGRKGETGKIDDAMKVCEHFMRDAVGDKLGKLDPQAYDQAVKFAQCMREHGVDVADPKPGEGVRIKLKGPDGEQKMKEAQGACKEYAPGRKP
ncbi:hypothetical protein JOL79_29695 [Microbispora sp. RL4-1S]|uniref:Secreted protein n=1 Tax=Microbispora oryzae TaxID=2806554 RepID=A0A940WQY7_9ACTN|nr:hypothetical protein [Microbispora oryzae]MBP2707962.1 hypothetical protein [Microbispora oryzae]